MGLRCSLLGHEYDEATVERDREERGNEVVITERELQECQRCGTEKVISENTEVRSLEPEPEPEPATNPESAPESAPTSGPAESEPAADSPAELSSGTEPAETGGVSSFTDDTESGTPDTADSFEPPASPEADDAVILDDDGETEEPTPERRRGEWPDADDHRQSESAPDQPSPETGNEAETETTGPATAAEPDAENEAEVLDADGEAGRDAAAEEAATATAWPDHDGEDRGYAAEADDNEFQFGSESISDEDIETAAAESAAAESDQTETEFVESGSGITSAGPFEESDSDTIDTVLVCPECGLEREAAGSSLRAGDICPECKRGYLAER